MTNNEYLESIITKYTPHSEIYYQTALNNLQNILNTWASTCSPSIVLSGSNAKDTAVSICSDIDYLISIASTSKVGEDTSLKAIYNSLYETLEPHYSGKIRKQNVSIRVELSSMLKTDLLEVDITPARRHDGCTNWHSLYLSKLDTWRQTNVRQHINDISNSGRNKEIKLLKIWRELNTLDFPSIYLEYLLVSNVLSYKPKSSDVLEILFGKSLANNFYHILTKLASGEKNPLFDTITDPANSGNILSDLLTNEEKNKIIKCAKISISKKNWKEIVF